MSREKMKDVTKTCINQVNEKEEETMDQMLTVTEAARLLNVHRRSLLGWLKGGFGPASMRTPGGRIRINKKALESWIETHTEEVGS